MKRTGLTPTEIRTRRSYLSLRKTKEYYPWSRKRSYVPQNIIDAVVMGMMTIPHAALLTGCSETTIRDSLPQKKAERREGSVRAMLRERKMEAP